MKGSSPVRATVYVDAFNISIPTLRGMGLSVLRPAVQCTKTQDLCGLVDCSEQDRTTVLNHLDSMILRQYTTITNQY